MGECLPTLLFPAHVHKYKTELKHKDWTCASMQASFVHLHRAPFRPARSAGGKRRCYRAAQRSVLSMAASKSVLVPVGTGSEEMEAVRAKSV